jgi:glycosyltransferase involved in cell wall biosynthesis
MAVVLHGGRVSVIIPCYNEAQSLREVLRRVEEVQLPVGKEVIVVDDGSTDGSPEVAQEFPFVKLLRHKKNLGKGAALKTGLKHASGDWIVIQDADLEYDPLVIPALIEPLMKGEADVVLGSRFKRQPSGMALTHRFANKMLSSAGSTLLGLRVTDIMTGHKAFTREAYRKVTLTSREFEVEAELVCKFASAGLRILEVPIPYRRRPFGTAKINWRHGFRSLYVLVKHAPRENLYAILLFASTFLYYMAFNLHNNLVGFKGRRGLNLLNGDEPHYLIVAESVIQDHDFKLDNNYASNPWGLQASHVVAGGDGLYSAHGIGLPLLIAPFYHVGGLLLTQAFLSLLSALLVTYVYKSCLRMVTNREASFLAAAILGFASLLVPYSNQIFPEIPMALILVLSLYYLCVKPLNSLKGRYILLLGALMGYSPLLKTPYIAFAIPFTAYIAFTSRENRLQRLTLYLTPIVVLGLVLAAYQQAAFGNPLKTPQTFQAGNVVDGLLGLMLDRNYGLFTYSPVLALSIAGLPRFYHASRRVFAVASTLFLTLYLTSSAWVSWHGGWSYPARLIIPVVPLAALPLAYSIAQHRRRAWFKLLLYSFTVLSLAVNFAITWIRGLGLGDGPSKRKILQQLFAWFQRGIHMDLNPILVDFTQPKETLNWLVVFLILTALLALFLISLKDARRRLEDG